MKSEYFWVWGFTILLCVFTAFVLFLNYEDEKECTKAGGVRVRTYSGTVCIDAKALK